ncbi:MAG: hypothetical protein L0G99_14705, partial [Propionibacteriales bacterium]|nr:hypothetical protein [Propionibacteriales bacterium]
VEPRAKRRGTTKGSFYWHFADRAALIDAALAIWEREHTDAVIELAARASEGGSAGEQLRALLQQVISRQFSDRIELGLLSSTSDPRVRSALQRVTARRVDHVATLYEGMGMSSRAAHERSVIAISVYLGHLQLRHIDSATLPTNQRAWASHLDLIMDVLTGEEPAP